jgi:hypothetical protein
LCDYVNLKCTFCRCVDRMLLSLWEELVELVSTIMLTEENDGLIWQFHSSDVHSSQSLYAVINFRGVKPTYLPGVHFLMVGI